MTTQSTRPPRLADGSSRGKNFYSACVRALDAYLNLSRLADSVLAELDKMTSGIVEAAMSDNDSLVIVLADFGHDE